MRLLIVFELEKPDEARKLDRFLRNFGIKLKTGVYECECAAQQEAQIRKTIENMKTGEKDFIGIFQLCSHCAGNILRIGNQVRPLTDEWVIL